MTEIKPLYFRLTSLVLLVLGLTWLAHLFRPQAANLTSVSVTMDNSRVSYLGEVVGTPGSDTTIDIDILSTINDYTDGVDTLITDALKVTDTITFSTSGARTVQEIVDADTIVIDTAVTAAETFYLAETSALTVEFDTNTVVTTGYFEVLVPAAAANNADGVPDQGFFDYGTAPTVGCTGAVHSFGTGTGAAGQTGTSPNGAVLPGDNLTDYWHVYTCPYTTGGVDSVEIEISNIINPVRIDSLLTGQADTYEVIVRNVRDADDEVIDSTTTKIGVIEAVRVSATVVPSLTFEIFGDTAGETRCGLLTHVTTTAASVPFGEIGTGVFKNAAQRLKFTTNAIGGAVVTAIANDQLGREGGTCTGKLNPVYALNPSSGEHLCIWDANVTSMSETVEQDWTTESDTGFGYSLQDIDSTPAFEYNGAGTFDARHFADLESAQDPVQIFSSIYPTNSDSVYVCYQIVPDALTAAGDYYNYITYTATATF